MIFYGLYFYLILLNILNISSCDNLQYMYILTTITHLELFFPVN